MSVDRDIERIAVQERLIQFEGFDADSAWELGTRLRAAALSRGVAMYIEVRLHHETVFVCAMKGSTPANADWARRKRNTTELLHRSSYAVGLGLQREGISLESKMSVPPRDYASHGGGFPIRVKSCGVVGCATVSGAPQRQDHVLVTEVMASFCGIPLADIALD
jgi:uncharacterized protein (UPF0303 family)